MDAISHLLRLADLFSAASGLAETTISSRCFTDGKRLAAIRGGSDVGARRLARAVQWFSDHWPAGAAWPADIPRPAPPTPANDTGPSASEDAA